MRANARLLSVVVGIVLSLGGCVVGDTGGGDGGGNGGGDGNGDGDGDGDGDGVGGGNELTGQITDSRDLSGDIVLSGAASIAAGAQVTIAAGSSFTAAEGAKLTVAGTLLVNGTSDATVSMIPADGATAWGGIVVDSGGAASLEWVTGTGVTTLMDCKAGAATCSLKRIDFEDVGRVMVAASPATVAESRVVGMSNGAVSVGTGGNLTIVDTALMTSDHDLVVASGGTLLIEWSAIGGTVDTYEHCNLHIGRADSLTITNTNIVTGEYGMMIGGVDGAVVNMVNFEGNDPGNDVSPVGTVTNADFTGNYWDQGAPGDLGGEYDVSSPADVRIDGAGPRITW